MSRKLTMYGLAHCSTCQKAQAALQDHGWSVEFRDVQKEPLSQNERTRLVAEFGDKIINRASLTWRGMSEQERLAEPVAMMGEKPSVMKRPAIMADDLRLLGWTANVKRALDVPA
ncbi:MULTISPECIES: ArsC/Spx/MgsR family protein [unclassified Paracoccus (in: a-proteobacteria)]|uniref:arsenate reductase family protein n=1 Tax=unclassified Paracoccus (in: a-proteobacteria) TaxID=2688777 RepID=UPI001FFE1163|nr:MULTISPECIES: ArsC/Spx/MgsR family protein [unclassified Paracoccus (in: a-proteobacteria)]